MSQIQKKEEGEQRKERVKADDVRLLGERTDRQKKGESRRRPSSPCPTTGKNPADTTPSTFDKVFCESAQELLTYITLIAAGTLSTADTIDSPMRCEGCESKEFSATRVDARMS